MIEWSEQHQMIRDAVRRFVEAEIEPRVEEFEHGDTPPYEILRKLFRTFGMDELARARFAAQQGGRLESRPTRSPQGRDAAVQRGEAERSVGPREEGQASEGGPLHELDDSAFVSKDAFVVRLADFRARFGAPR